MPVYAPVIGTGINNNYSFSTFSTSPPVSGSVYTIDGAGGTDTFVFAKGVTYLNKFLSTGFTIAPADASGVIVVTGASAGGTQLTFNLKSVEQLVFGNGTVQLVYNVNQLPTGAVTISGTPTQNQTLTAVSTLADANGLGTLSYQWSAADVAITGATASTLTLAEAQVGKAITVKVSYTDLLGTAESVLSTATAAVTNVNDLPSGAVTISGTATQGQTLTAVTSALADPDGLGAFSYQWYAGGTVITGATGITRVLTLAEVGKVITVKASYTDGHGTLENVISSATAAVAHLNTAPTGSVTITGTATQGQTLTASNSLADVDGITPPITYQWYAGGTAITGATGNTHVLTQTEVGKAITVKAGYTDGFSTVESVGSAATTAVANVNDLPTGSVTISGTASTGQTLTASSNTLADLDGITPPITYQWKANGTVISGATGSTYLLTLAEANKTITATASYTDGYGAVESVTSAATAAVFTNTAPTGAVTIGGTVTQNQQLTAVTSALVDVDGLGSFSYQWKANGVAIAGATASTLTLAEAQVGKTITVQTSYTDGRGAFESVVSTATAAVVNVNDAPTGAVTISGTATQGQTLTAVTSALADPDGLGAFSYQWYAGGTAITGATGITRVLTLAEVGKVITVKASYTDGHDTPESVTSSATAAVAHINTAPTGSVTITGTATQGQTLTASNSLADVDGITPPITYQWYAGGTAITGATGNTHVLTQTEVGKAITVKAGYTDGFSTVESVGSAATTAVANVNDLPTGSVTISGTASTGQTLTASSNTLADLDGITPPITYQWKANGTVISGATGSTYLLTLAEANKTITATASYTDGYGAVESVTSAATAAVFTNTAPTGAVTIGGTVTQNQQLTAVTSALVDVDGLGSFSYQWKANGVAIAGATASTLTLAEAQVGKTITVQTSYTDGRGAFESVLSTATAAVVNVNDLPTGAVTISGTATQNQTLTAVTSALADPDGLGTFSYQWKDAGTAITGATASTLTLAEAQVGKAITVNVNYTDGHGTAESVLSTATAAVVNVNDAPTGAVTITGTATEEHTLTASTSTLADADGLGTITYKWYTGATLISGTAVASTYTLKESDVNKDINVVATYTDGHSTVEQVSSAVVPYGVTISSETANGTVTTTTTVHEVTDRTAIHLVPGILDVTLPEDIGLVEREFTGTAINGLAAQLGADPLISRDLLPGINAYVATAPQQVTVRSLSFDTSSQPILISGVGTVGQEALVIDANGSNLKLDNVEFALVIGPATITGGAGNNVVYADRANQHIVLGVGDDTLHGGAGDDYIGSLAGNDHLFGDAGNDTLSGGADNDTLDGGAGTDTAVFSGNFLDYAITYDTLSSSYTITDTVAGRDGTDVVTNVELFQFLDFPNGKTDIIAPTVASFAPADAATGVAVGSNIVLNFSEAIQKGTGLIEIRSGSLTGNVVASSADATISGSALTINPTADLTTGTHYYVTLANGSIDDLAGNHYAGTSAYDFTTASAATAFAASDSGGGGGAGVALAGVGALGLLAFVLF